MAEERNNGGGGRTAATAGIIALLLLLGGGGYFGLGPGQGMLPGNGDSVQQEQSESQGEAKEAAAQTEQDQKEEAVSEIPDNIIVTIKKDVVTINGHEVAERSTGMRSPTAKSLKSMSRSTTAIPEPSHSKRRSRSWTPTTGSKKCLMSWISN